MARKKKEDAPVQGAPAWMATYGDMITLVLTFFVLLFSMSSVDIEKFKAMVQNLTGNPYIFSVQDNASNIGNTGLEKPPNLPEDIFSDPTDAWQNMAQGLQDEFDKWNGESSGEGEAGMTAGISIVVTEGQINILVQGEILFLTLSDVLTPSGTEAMEFIMGEVMRYWVTGIIDEIHVEGHADIRPIPRGGSKFEDNLMLSQARAAAAYRYIVNNFDIPDSKLGAVGYGATRPVDGDFGTGEEQYSLNRRVEFVLHRNFFYDEETGEAYERH